MELRKRLPAATVAALALSASVFALPAQAHTADRDPLVFVGGQGNSHGDMRNLILEIGFTEDELVNWSSELTLAEAQGKHVYSVKGPSGPKDSFRLRSQDVREAILLAAAAHPLRKVDVVGFSAGGLTSRYAIKVYERARVLVDAWASLDSPNRGIFGSFGDYNPYSTFMQKINNDGDPTPSRKVRYTTITSNCGAFTRHWLNGAKYVKMPSCITHKGYYENVLPGHDTVKTVAAEARDAIN